MSSTSELGYGKNVAALNQLIKFCKSQEKKYAPPRAEMQIDALTSLYNLASKSISDLNSINVLSKNAIAQKNINLKELPALLTQINYMLKALNLPEEIYKTTESLLKKLKGVRAKARKTDEEKIEALEAGKSINENSSSQVDFDSKMDNFDKLIKTLQSILQYKPNEAKLKIEYLIELRKKLLQNNEDILTSKTESSRARSKRDEILYKDGSGLVSIGNEVKSYLKAIFPKDTAEYAEIVRIQFRGN